MQIGLGRMTVIDRFIEQFPEHADTLTQILID